MDSAAKTNVVTTYISAINNKNIAEIVSLFASNATLEDPVGSEVKRGIDEIADFYQGIKTLQMAVQLSGSVRCAGNAAAFPFCLTLSGLSIDVIDVFEFDEAGKIVSMKAYWST